MYIASSLVPVHSPGKELTGPATPNGRQSLNRRFNFVHPSPTPQTTWLSRPLRLTAALALLATGAMVGPAAIAAPAPAETGWAASAYRGGE